MWWLNLVRLIIFLIFLHEPLSKLLVSPLIMENQMEKKMENEMETTIYRVM